MALECGVLLSGCGRGMSSRGSSRCGVGVSVGGSSVWSVVLSGCRSGRLSVRVADAVECHVL